MKLTAIRRHVADNYVAYAFTLKCMYVTAFALLSQEFVYVATLLIVTTIVADVMTDGFVIHTIMRSRTRLKAWRIVAVSFGGKRGMDRYLEKRAVEFAKRSGDYLHWEKRFALIVFAFTRIIDYEPRGDGRIADYLPHDEDSMHAAT